jgi:hypothetical protein
MAGKQSKPNEGQSQIIRQESCCNGGGEGFDANAADRRINWQII